LKAGGLILVNGEQSCGVDPLDRGLHYGDGVFRTLKVSSRQVLWWDDHFSKLGEDCAALALPCPERELLEGEMRQLAADSDLGGLKIIITRGPGPRGYGIPANTEPTRIVTGFPAAERELRDVNVRWCELRLAAQTRLAGIKHLNRLENVLARSEWNDPDIVEGLLMDEAGHVICGTMTNLFIVEQGRLVTPDLSQCGVAGVTRSRIMRAAERYGRPAKVEPISRQRLLAADAVFLCNSLIHVWRVARLDEKQWQDNGWAEELRNWVDEDN
jgi:4-amino-4-deoxychorismate lyase